jgi:hypothetical protein
MAFRSDIEFVVFLSGATGCSLDSSPKKNWVENEGGLPDYICRIARAVMKSGKSKSSAIAIAISRVKKWAGGGDDVDADTRAKAAKAVAEWEALKAKAHTKLSRRDGSEYLMLSNTTSFNTEWVRRAWNGAMTSSRQDIESRGTGESLPYSYVREIWNDRIIVEIEGPDRPEFAQVPYSVDGGTVSFGQPTTIHQEWVADEELSDTETKYLDDVLVLSSPEQRIHALYKKLTKADGDSR